MGHPDYASKLRWTQSRFEAPLLGRQHLRGTHLLPAQRVQATPSTPPPVVAQRPSTPTPKVRFPNNGVRQEQKKVRSERQNGLFAAPPGG